MPCKVKNLVINRVDMVDAGANYDCESGEGSHILLCKRADHGLGVQQGLQQFDDRVLGASHDWLGTTDPMSFKSATADNGDESMTEKNDPEVEVVKQDDQLEEKLAELEERQKQLEADLDAKNQELAAKDAVIAGLQKAETKDDDIWKGVSPEVKSRFEALEKRAEAAEAVARAEALNRVTREFVAKAAKLSNIPGKAEDVGDVLRKIHEIDAELETRVHTLLKAADEQIKAGNLFEEFGTATADETGGSAWGKIEKMAKNRAASEKVSHAVAIDRVLAENPELYAAYLEGV